MLWCVSLERSPAHLVVRDVIQPSRFPRDAARKAPRLGSSRNLPWHGTGGSTITQSPFLGSVGRRLKMLILQATVTPSYINRLLLQTVELVFRGTSLNTHFDMVGWQQWQRPYRELKGPEDRNWWRILWQSGFSSEDAKSENAPKEEHSKPLLHLEFTFTLQNSPF